MINFIRCNLFSKIRPNFWLPDTMSVSILLVYSIFQENRADFLVKNSITKLTLSLGLPRDLIRGFIKISMALKSGLPLDPYLFGALCREVKQRYYEVVPWAYMSPTVHKASTLLDSIFIPNSEPLEGLKIQHCWL